MSIGLAAALCFLVAASSVSARELTLDDIFPTDRVLDVQITVDEKDWDTIRHQSRDFVSVLHESRKVKPIDSPYTYVDASVTIDGVEFPQVGLRKKGFLGSLSTSRPALKIKLNHIDKKGGIDGLTNLTLNNNQQDVSLVSQFMGYAMFNAAGSPAPRCAYARVTVNGVNLGIYSHVQRVRKPFLKRAFGNGNGTLYEGPYVDFYEGWEGSFERKTGKNKPGREKIKQLIKVLEVEHAAGLLESDDENIEEAIGELVDLDSFYTFWAVEGLLGSWDGYSGNTNNFLIYLNPETDKFHFLPWGADSVFTKYSKLEHLYDPRAPISVKTQGLIAHRLYQQKSGRERYASTIMDIIEKHWNEEELLAETDRIEVMVKPHLVPSQSGRFAGSLDATRKFIRQRRDDIINEIADGMPEWEKAPIELVVIGSAEVWGAAANGDIKAIKQLLAKGADVNARDIKDGMTPLSWAALLSQTETAELLIQKGADVNARNRDGATSLHVAAFFGQAEAARLLIQKGADVNARSGDGATPLHVAAFLGRTATAELLIQKGADVNARNNDGATSLDALAIDKETTEFVATLLGIKVDEKEVEIGRTKIAGILRQHNAKSGYELQPLRDDIWIAARTGNMEAIKQHLVKGADVNDMDRKFGVTPLSWAALLGQTVAIELLIQRGADVNARGRDGGTPLHGAAFLGQTEAAELLIQKGADVNARDNNGATPLDASAMDWEITRFVAAFLGIKMDEEKVRTGRTKIAGILRQHDPQTGSQKR
ncbi:ankyrin repeat domain-containing protein [Candidatus Poribacteria bacterium]